jgi:uncharacterized protein YndB with AHSA1/START domain
MPAGDHAMLRDHDGRLALVFERMLAYPPERVWRALVAPEELADWHPTPFALGANPPAPGGQVSYISAVGAPEMPAGELLAYDPPRLLAYTWGEDELRWELDEHDDGCLLRLTHIFEDRFKAARDAAGWHLCLQALSVSLQRAPRPLRGSVPQLPEGWSELNRDYQRRFGIAPEQAAPPPSPSS